MNFIHNNNSSDPYFNAALEEYLLLNGDTSKQDLLLLYENDDCVVVGKNQSVYKEVNFQYLRSGTLVRRISGGGTVVHGKGNLCFAFISRFEDFKVNNYRYFNQRIVDALQKRGIPATFNARNDIICNSKKLSGNAQFTNRRNILSHGTLLIHADLEKLRFALQPNPFLVESRAVTSVRSPVMNISEVSPFNDVLDWKTFFLAEFGANEVHLEINQINIVNQMAENKMRSAEWIYGRSPRTLVIKNGITIAVQDGKIETISGLEDSGISEDALKGCYYSREHLCERLSPHHAEILF
ncbi:MAG: lipoate--protein ligase [Chitinophagales bacterium]